MPVYSNEKRGSTNYKILVVDDNNAHLQLMETWLNESGFSVVAVHDGYEAIGIFQKDLFDLVLTNICRPGINGNILAQFVHAFSKEIPVIAVTASPYLAGPDFDLVLSKPYELEGLVNSLQYVLQKIPPASSNLNSNKHKLLHQLQEFEHGH
ncbi:MAG: response regulator [Desulfuromusa sp.]|jgi:CheY-like chemotaxis protein|nr:response regulator [Desulfuromusa sp.]